MSSEIIPPDIEATILDYLRPLLGVPCVSLIPATRPATFLMATAVPSVGIVNRGLFEALVSVEAWAATKPAASLLARKAVAYLEATPDFYARCGGPGWLPDPISGAPRYVFTATVAIRTQILT